MSRSITAIHQFHHGVDAGDGVTNSLFFIQKLLRNLGFESELYAANIPPSLRSQVKPYRELTDCGSAQPILLQHHSMGHDLGPWLTKLPLSRALVYHNITPPDFFSPGSDIRRYAELGREQLTEWRDDFAAVLSVSEYNAEDLVALGYPRDAITVLPLLVDLEKLASSSAHVPDIARCVHPSLAHRPVLLFVGRIVENKRQHLLLEMLWHLQRMQRSIATEAQPILVLAGGGVDSPYGRFLRQRMHQLHLDDSVIMTGKIDDSTLQALYRQSAAFVCASAHEGFGMPLVEAMLADCPVVAMGLTNVPHTLGEGGLILDNESPAAMAAALSLLLQEAELRSAILAGQQRSLDRYEPLVLREAFSRWLRESLQVTVQA